MPLNETPEQVTWPETHYAFVEKIGEFPVTAPQAWQELHKHVPELLQSNTPTGFMSLYKIDDSMIYRAGVALTAQPKQLPPGLAYQKFSGGKYVRFTLTGSYAQLPEACGRVFEIVLAAKTKIRGDAFFIENYVNDPRTTPEDQLVTQILVPVV